MKGLDGVGNPLSVLAKAERKESLIAIDWVRSPSLVNPGSRRERRSIGGQHPPKVGKP
jgi:hypothetical protein